MADLCGHPPAQGRADQEAAQREQRSPEGEPGSPGDRETAKTTFPVMFATKTRPSARIDTASTRPVTSVRASEQLGHRPPADARGRGLQPASAAAGRALDPESRCAAPTPWLREHSDAASFLQSWWHRGRP